MRSLAASIAIFFHLLDLSTGVPHSEPQVDSHWETLPSIPSYPRQEHTTVALSDSIYVLAGVIPNDTASVLTTGLVQRYSISTRKWQTTSPIPIALNHANVAVVAGKIYVLGGLALDNVGAWTAVPDCLVYEPRRNKWKKLSPMPSIQARGSAAVGVHGSKVYLAGGMRSLVLAEGGLQDTVATVTVYDTATGIWDEISSLEEGRDHAGAAVVGDLFYVLGGRYRGQSNVRGTVFALDLSRIKSGWKSLASMPTPRGGVATGVIDEKIYIFGGEGNPEEGSNGVYNQTEVYDVERNIWERLQPMRVPRHGTSSVGVDGQIYIPGGGTVLGGSGLVNTFDSFAP